MAERRRADAGEYGFAGVRTEIWTSFVVMLAICYLIGAATGLFIRRASQALRRSSSRAAHTQTESEDELLSRMPAQSGAGSSGTLVAGTTSVMPIWRHVASSGTQAVDSSARRLSKVYFSPHGKCAHFYTGCAGAAKVDPDKFVSVPICKFCLATLKT